MNKLIKTTLTAGVLLIVYGFLVKATGIRFFWESSALGWDLSFIGLILLLVQQQKKRRAVGRNTVLIKIGIGLLAFILVIQTVLGIAISNSDAYIAAKNYVLKNDSLKKTSWGTSTCLGLSLQEAWANFRFSRCGRLCPNKHNYQGEQEI